mmetsp:Transcript_31484/g.70093  ORF Transcript_31484/g.70093 Transcript_31484/m.70093 type:complete len:292 (-) Transcript_31484:521-1396(-)
MRGTVLTAVLLVVLGIQAYAQDSSELSLDGVKLAILASDGKSVLSTTGKYPAALLSKPQIPGQQSLEVTLSVSLGGNSFKPQQVMLLLKHKATGVGAYAVGKTKGSGYTITINNAAVEKQIGKLAGAYEVNLLVGDASAAKGIDWKLGEVELVIADADPAAKPTVRTASVQPVDNLKPVINHVFRAPDKRAPAIISLVFTALALAPLLGVVVYVTGFIGINFNGFPKEGSVRTAALAFHGMLAGMLFMYAMFWLKWNLIQTLPRVLLLSIPLAFAGHHLLSGLASTRLKKD